MPRQTRRRPMLRSAPALAEAFLFVGAALACGSTVSATSSDGVSIDTASIDTASIDAAAIDYGAELGARDGCFRVVDVASGEVVVEHGTERCRLRQPPCSTLKVPLLAVAFEEGALARVDEVVPWDGRVHRREGRQLAWFAGVYEAAAGRPHAFVLTFADREPTSGYAGGVARDLARDFLVRLDAAGALAAAPRPALASETP